MKNITLSLLATTILSTAAMPAFAAKEPEIYFYPAKTWVVGHADTPTDCAVQSEFNNGFVLQFDGTKKWVESFSINFRQGIFNEGENYDISLSVPGKTSKKFSATATSNTMLTVPLREQKEIYQHARDAAVLDVGIDENNFRFYLVNFGPAANNFERCMAGGEIKNPTPAAAPVAPVESEHISPKVLPAPAEQEPLRDALAEPEPLVPASIAPPPPSQLSAAPDAAEMERTAMINESIALEEQEANNQKVTVTEILPEDPKPTVTEIPYTEKVKLGDQVLTKEQQAELETNPTPKTMPADIARQQPYRKRMSEQLAEQIGMNPTIADADAEPQSMPPAPTPVLAQEPEAKREEIIQAEIEQPAPEPLKATIQPMVETKKPTPAEIETAAKQPEPVTMSGKTEAEQALTRQALAQTGAIAPTIEEPKTQAFAAASMPEPIMPQPAAPPEAAPQPVAAPAPAMHVETPNAPVGLVPHPSSTPFAERRPVIETNTAKKEEAPKPEEKIAATEAIEEPIVPAPVDAPAVSPITRENYKSPEMKVTRQEYRGDADFTGLDSMEPAGTQETGMTGRRTADPEMLHKISDLEAEVNKLQKENASLNDELTGTLGAAKEETASISSENWNLERATMRFTEAERQVKRLGDQIQRERAQCTGEKKDLEAMLFDPQVTNQQQLAKLADLEQKLAQAQQDIADQRMRFEERIKILQSQSATQ